jgi:hypothetical protein
MTVPMTAAGALRSRPHPYLIPYSRPRKLPFVFVADGTQEEMTMPPDFDFQVLTNLFQSFMASQAAGGNSDPVAMLLSHCAPGCNIL